MKTSGPLGGRTPNGLAKGHDSLQRLDYRSMCMAPSLSSPFSMGGDYAMTTPETSSTSKTETALSVISSRQGGTVRYWQDALSA